MYLGFYCIRCDRLFQWSVFRQRQSSMMAFSWRLLIYNLAIITSIVAFEFFYVDYWVFDNMTNRWNVLELSIGDFSCREQIMLLELIAFIANVSKAWRICPLWIHFFVMTGWSYFWNFFFFAFLRILRFLHMDLPLWFECQFSYNIFKIWNLFAMLHLLFNNVLS